MDFPTIDLNLFLIVALGNNSYLHNEIDEIYKENQWSYYEEFKNSEYYNDILIKSFTPQKEERMKKVAGILLLSFRQNNMAPFERLIKKGYKDVLRYYEQNRNKINLQEFMIYMNKRRGEEIGLSEIGPILYIAVLAYIVDDRDGRDKMIEIYKTTEYGNIIFRSMGELILDIQSDITIQAYLEDDKEITYEKVLEFASNTLKIDLNKKVPSTVESLFNFAFTQEIEKEIRDPSSNIHKESLIETLEEMGRNSSLVDGFKYMHGSYLIFQNSGIYAGDHLNAKITKDELLKYAYISLCRGEYTEDEKKHHFIASLFIHALITQYKEQKEILVDDTMEAWYLDVKMKEQRLESQENFYKETKENLEAELKRAKDKNKKDIEEIEKLMKENERLKQEILNNQHDKEELVELRNFVYNQQKINFVPNELPIGEMMKVLNGKKIIVCGGHPNMQRKLKEWMPNLDTLSTETIGKDFAYLRGYDVVYFYSNYASHSFYKKIKLSIYDSNAKFVYLPDVDNIEQLIMNMYEHITIETRV